MLYKWPQGRVIRTIFLGLTLIIACDLAYSGSFAQYEAWSRGVDGATANNWRPMAYCVLYGVLAVGALVTGLLTVGILPKTAQFFIEVEQEMVKVTWPKTNEVVRSTIIIGIMTVILALLIFLVDLLNITIVHDRIFGLES